LAAAQFFAC
jgi:hypothetical protein